MLCLVLIGCSSKDESKKYEDSAVCDIVAIESDSDVVSQSTLFTYERSITPFSFKDSMDIPQEWVLETLDPLEYADAGMNDQNNMNFNHFCGIPFGGFINISNEVPINNAEWWNLFGRSTNDSIINRSLVVHFLRDLLSLKPIILFNGRILNLKYIVQTNVYYDKEHPFVSLEEYLSSNTSRSDVQKMILDDRSGYNIETAAKDKYNWGKLIIDPVQMRTQWPGKVFTYLYIRGFGGSWYLNTKDDYDCMQKNQNLLSQFSRSTNNKEFEHTQKLTSVRLVRDDVIIPGDPEATAALSNATMRNEVVDAGERVTHFRIEDGGRRLIVNGETLYENAILVPYTDEVGDKIIAQYFYKGEPHFRTFIKSGGTWKFQGEGYRQL